MENMRKLIATAVQAALEKDKHADALTDSDAEHDYPRKSSPQRHNSSSASSSRRDHTGTSTRRVRDADNDRPSSERRERSDRVSRLTASATSTSFATSRSRSQRRVQEVSSSRSPSPSVIKSTSYHNDFTATPSRMKPSSSSKRYSDERVRSDRRDRRRDDYSSVGSDQ